MKLTLEKFNNIKQYGIRVISLENGIIEIDTSIPIKFSTQLRINRQKYSLAKYIKTNSDISQAFIYELKRINRTKFGYFSPYEHILNLFKIRWQSYRTMISKYYIHLNDVINTSIQELVAKKKIKTLTKIKFKKIICDKLKIMFENSHRNEIDLPIYFDDLTNIYNDSKLVTEYLDETFTTIMLPYTLNDIVLNESYDEGER